MKVLRQIEIDDKQRHREGENAVGQGIEPGFRNKLLGFNHHPSPVFQSNLRRYVSLRGNPEQSDALFAGAHERQLASVLQARQINRRAAYDKGRTRHACHYNALN